MTTATSAGAIPKGESIGSRALRIFLRNRMAVVCFTIVAFYVLIAILGWVGLLPDFQERVGGSYEAPSLEFSKIVGTDIFGRSVFYKILIGTRTAMTIGFFVTAISIPIGIEHNHSNSPNWWNRLVAYVNLTRANTGRHATALIFENADTQ